MKSYLLKTFLVAFIGFNVVGCGTIVRTGFDNTPNPCKKELSYVFGGVKLDSMHICTAAASHSNFRKIIIPFALVDLPLSAIADTVILPYSAYLDHRTDSECAMKGK
ncbi:YceK/YidQ family lipoprotein [Microbulbifer salipaludis]|uniref:YceK/YidQ family lipoprotein n=1 Tax=Microbulbifer salipaludis TaxID=187980 RepID=A0ABS3E8B8_9GAMM|nr:YceK/YidQ family lipoprotein [Microbulbifer salipaludis]